MLSPRSCAQPGCTSTTRPLPHPFPLAALISLDEDEKEIVQSGYCLTHTAQPI